MRKVSTCGTLFLALMYAASSSASDPDWPTVPLIQHSTFQAVDGNGNTTYAGGFPIRLRGIVLNNPEDWLDPTPAYDPGVHLWELGGQWEIFVQAWDEPNLAYDDGDFGGTAAWMGQNYGNHVMHQNPFYNYTDDEWLNELDRLDFPPGDGTAPLRAGDLIEIRARSGLFYKGKMNVNEQHNNDRDPNTLLLGNDHDFEIVRLVEQFGLPTPYVLTLSDLKTAADEPIFDPSRQTGGERYQSTRVTIQDVELADAVMWGPAADLTITDATGRTFTLHVGRRGAFAKYFPPNGTFDVTGVINQEAAGFPPDSRTGYFLMALDPEEFDPPLQRCGDMNCDGQLDYFDIQYLLDAFDGAAQWAQQYPDCPWLNGDLDYDGDVDYFDINPWLDALQNGGLCP